MSSGFTSDYRIKLLATGILAGFAVVGMQLVRLHVLERPARLAEINRARQEVVVEHARRGDILDAHGDTLATSRTKVALAIDPWALDELLAAEKKPERRERLRQSEQQKRARLAELLGLPVAELEKLYQPVTRDPRSSEIADPRNLVEGRIKVRFVKFNEGVEESLYARLTDGKLYPQLDPKTSQPTPAAGLVGSRYGVRTYPQGQLAAHVVGFINADAQPVTGIENFADFYLRGADGWRESEKDGRGRELAQFRTREMPAADGYTVVLSIDAAVQRMAEQELAQVADKFHPQKATIIVSDARTGFLLALANWPTFDLNHYNQVTPDGIARLNNLAVTDVYEPGSVFKIVAASGALEDRLVTPASTFDCTLPSIVFNGRIRNLPAEDKSDHFDHPLSVAEIIAHSSNKGAAQLGMLLGQQKFYDYARRFGFGERTAIGGPEKTGWLHRPEERDFDITRLPMGHSVDVTVLQMHQAMGVIASGGRLLRPQLIREVRDARGSAVYRYAPVVRGRAISESTARTMAQLLMGVAASGGTAPNAAIAGFEVAGKTGTTQKLIEHQYSTTHHVASFVGFFPASRPEVVISVIVDDGHPPGGGVAYGRLVAAPSFRHLAEQLIPYLDIKPVVAPGGSGLFALKAAF